MVEKVSSSRGRRLESHQPPSPFLSSEKDWGNNMMAEFGGKVDQRNIDDVLSKNKVKKIEE